MQPSFSPSIVHIIAHPPALFKHLAKEFLAFPPPISDSPKFWNAFLPLRERQHDIESVVYGAPGDGSGMSTEFVVELFIRSRDGGTWRRNIERIFEGWDVVRGKACPLTQLETMKELQKPYKQMDDEVRLCLPPASAGFNSCGHQSRPPQTRHIKHHLTFS
jgi:elongator complex protein 5